MWVLREGSARTYFDTYPNRLTFGFTVSVPRTIALKVDPPNPSALNSFAYAIREDLTVGEVGFGYRFNREVSVGVAFGGVLRASERHSSWLLASQVNPRVVRPRGRAWPHDARGAWSRLHIVCCFRCAGRRRHVDFPFLPEG